MVNIVKNVVNACRGLHLSLKVVGGTLHGFKRLLIWVRALQRLRKATSLGLANNNDLWLCLRISFDDLTQEDMNLYLDLCCYFNKDLVPMGMSKIVTSLDLWKVVNKNPQESLKRLEDTSLLKIDKDGIYEVHEQLRDMGRMIVETDPIYIGTRWWKFRQQYGVSKHKKLDHIECLSFNEPTKKLKSYFDITETSVFALIFLLQGFEGSIPIDCFLNQLESLLVTHVGPSQEGIEPTVPCSNLTRYIFNYLYIMRSCSLCID